MKHEDYTLAWICALDIELTAAIGMLDERHDRLSRAPGDPNTYTLGKISGHNVAVIGLPAGEMGVAAAASAASHVSRSFPSIRYRLMVGVGGGAPSKKHDIRLGDVVVSQPSGTSGGVIKYDHGKSIEQGRFVRTGQLDQPPKELLTVLKTLQAEHRLGTSELVKHLLEMGSRYPQMETATTYLGAQHDQLFQADYDHQTDLQSGDESDFQVKPDTCGVCDSHRVVHRSLRSNSIPVVHYGLIASADQVMKDGVKRNKLQRELDILCFEMEAAGLMNNFPCLVIRGICDYSDTHKNKDWQPYAAATAAAYAKEFLRFLPEAASESNVIPGETVRDDFQVQFFLTGIPVTSHFVDRNTEMKEIEDSLQPANTIAGRRIYILHGLGGIGKTQLAIAYIRKHQNSYSAILWLNGSSRATLLQDLAAFGRHARINLSPESAASTTQRIEDLEAEAQAVLQWLALPGNRGWLMAMDNVDREYNPEVDNPQSFDISLYLPPTDHGCILITSRLQSLRDIGRPTEIKRLDPKQAIELLSDRSGLPQTTIGMEELVERLGHLPLALVQAGKYIIETGTSCSKYLELYTSSWLKLVAENPNLRDYKNGSIHTTWTISYEKVAQTNPTAAKLLQLWTNLDHQDIWYELFHRGSRGCEDCSWVQDLVQDEISFKKIVKTLLAYSLVESRRGIESYTIHPVVHDWCSETICRDNNELVQLAAIIVGFAVPVNTEQEFWLLQRRLLPHADKCIQRLYELDLTDTIPNFYSSNAFHGLGILYSDQGKQAEAEDMYQRALSGYEKASGPEHTSTLNTVNNLGNLYTHQGKLAEAEEMYQRALSGFEQAWGPEHISTLDTVNNLGALYKDQGKLAEAEEMYQRALIGYENVWGPKHTSTLNTVNNLGNLYRDQGKLAEAEEMYQRALSGYEKASGPEHTSTLDTVNNLGVLYMNQGKLAEAEEMYQRALSGYEKAWGPEHTSTLETVNNLGNLYTHQGKLAEAEEMLQRALSGKEKTWGPEHTSTLDTVNNLGLLYKDQGKLAEAEEMLQRALSGYQKLRGPDHPSTALIRRNLNRLRKQNY